LAVAQVEVGVGVGIGLAEEELFEFDELLEAGVASGVEVDKEGVDGGGDELLELVDGVAAALNEGEEFGGEVEESGGLADVEELEVLELGDTLGELEELDEELVGRHGEVCCWW